MSTTKRESGIELMRIIARGDQGFFDHFLGITQKAGCQGAGNIWFMVHGYLWLMVHD